MPANDDFGSPRRSSGPGNPVNSVRSDTALARLPEKLGYKLKVGQPCQHTGDQGLSDTMNGRPRRSEGRLIYTGRVGTGMSIKTLTMLHERPAPLRISTMPLCPHPRQRGAGSAARWRGPRCIGCGPV